MSELWSESDENVKKQQEPRTKKMVGVLLVSYFVACRYVTHNQNTAAIVQGFRKKHFGCFSYR